MLKRLLPRLPLAFWGLCAMPGLVNQLVKVQQCRDADGCVGGGSLQSLIKQLLRPDPDRRLGSLAGGAGDIKAHPFFAGMDWEALLRRE